MGNNQVPRALDHIDYLVLEWKGYRRLMGYKITVFLSIRGKI